MPSSLAVGDIDGDGQYEVVAACRYDGEVYAYRVAMLDRCDPEPLGPHPLGHCLILPVRPAQALL